MTAYEADNIFARMIRGEIPAHRVFEDDNVLAIMDIFPQSRGHVLVIPKAPARNLFDADPTTLAAAMAPVQRIAKALRKALAPAGLRLVQYNEAPAGQSVFHLHFHLIPVYEGAELGRHGEGRADDGELATLAKEIAAAL